MTACTHIGVPQNGAQAQRVSLRPSSNAMVVIHRGRVAREGFIDPMKSSSARGQRLDAVSADPFSETGPETEALPRRDREILGFERQWWKYAGAKEQAIRELFDMSATRYYQVLNGLIDRPEALAFDPMLVKRLRRLRASRQRQRSARRLGIDLER